MTSFIDDDGNELEYDGKDFALTKQIISVFDLSFRSNVSVNIKLTASVHNRAVLNFHRFNQVNGSQLVSQTFNLVQNGNKIDRGSIVLIDDNEDNLNVFFASGNFEWFGSFNFMCHEIRTTRWDVIWGNYSVKNLASATEGIIFPIVDWNFRHEKFSKFISYHELEVGVGDTGSLDDFIPETYPCLYIHTLVKELANHSGVNITGSLLTDGFYKSLILTPPGANFKDPVTGEQVFQRNVVGHTAIATSGTLVKPEMIAPRIKAIDFIKWLSVTFGCIVSFDQAANSISLDVLTRYNKADAEDWSEYYRSHTEEYKDIKRDNFIKFKESVDPEVKAYNEVNETPFAELNIQSDRDTKTERTVYTSPFSPVFDKVGSADLRWACPYVPFVVLSDADSYTYTVVSDQGADAGNPPDDRRIRFEGTGFPFTTTATNVIVRIVDDNGLYDGFHTGNPVVASSSTAYNTQGRFKGTSSGTIYTQSAEKTSNQYVLVAVPGVSPSDFTISPGIFMTSEELTTVATAYFSKPYTPYSTLNTYNKGLAFGEINESFYNDITLKEAYLNPLTRALTQPVLKTKMLLPVDVFARFNGSKLIYLNTGKLNGYFVVQKIEQYRDSVTELFVYISNFE